MSALLLPNDAVPDWVGSPSSPALRWPGLGALGAEAVVTTRHGGVSGGPYSSLNLALHVGDDPQAVMENRRRAAAALGAQLEDLVVPEQVHGARCAVVNAAQRGRGAAALDDAVAGADALVTADRTVVLMVLMADCTPLLLVDPEAGVLAVVHAGWRGTSARVAEQALSAMEGLGAARHSVVALIGPAADRRSYQVDEPVAEAIGASLGEKTACLLPDGPGHWLLDLPAANRQLLEAAGVPSSHISVSALSTSDDRLFSHRRSGGRPCGRFGLLARLR